jgi:hypothetical protein
MTYFQALYFWYVYFDANRNLVLHWELR